MKSVAFYNAKAGVGCTALVYHLAWMLARLGHRVVAIDADPQGDLSGLFLGFDAYPWLEHDEGRRSASIGAAMMYGVTDGAGFLWPIDANLAVVVGDLMLEEWIAEFTHAHGLAFRGARSRIPEDLGSARLRRLVVEVGRAHDAELVLIDAGAGFGVCPCLAVTAADALIVPVSADWTAERGMTEAFSAAREWSTRWQVFVRDILDAERLRLRREEDERLAPGLPVETLDENDAGWLGRGPTALGYVLTGVAQYAGMTVKSDPDVRKTFDPGSCLGALTGWVDLRERALRARKPMFELSPADGALGTTAVAVQRARAEYEALARTIIARLGV